MGERESGGRGERRKRSEEVQDLFLPLPELLENEDMRRLLLQNYLTQRQKQLKHKSGLIIPLSVCIFQRLSIRILFNDYDNIIGKIVNMKNHPEKWSF
jgi:hypothetical protein